jgi:hypothetical protein
MVPGKCQHRRGLRTNTGWLLDYDAHKAVVQTPVCQCAGALRYHVVEGFLNREGP